MGLDKRILIVDDDERVLLVLHDILAKVENGYDVVTTQSSQEALDLFKEQSFDLVFTDLRMPDMNGMELTEAIRAVDSDVIVIWITAYDSREARDEAARLGVCDCLDKPLEVAEIRQAVRKALQATENRNQA